jgi:hypothetical protein
MNGIQHVKMEVYYWVDQIGDPNGFSSSVVDVTGERL